MNDLEYINIQHADDGTNKVNEKYKNLKIKYLKRKRNETKLKNLYINIKDEIKIINKKLTSRKKLQKILKNKNNNN